jgi:pyrimidine-nucleoside phosphorylase
MLSFSPLLSNSYLLDRKLYALRDVTGTVSSIPLQTSSIMCKKIAERPQSLVLDVKYGMGSFQSNVEQARELAESMIATGEANGLLPTTCLLTRMDDFLGHAVGNWNEVCECLDMLKTGRGCPHLKRLVVCQAAQMMQHSGLHKIQPFDELVELCLEQLNSGKAYPVFRKMVIAHGGDVKVLDYPETSPYHETKYKHEIFATHSGYLSVMDGHVLGMLAVQMGAGRKVADDPVDLGAGMTFAKKVGDPVQQGDLLCTLFTNRPNIIGTVVREMQERVLSYSTEPIEAQPIISHIVTSEKGLQNFEIPTCLLEDARKERPGLKRLETQ